MSINYKNGKGSLKSPPSLDKWLEENKESSNFELKLYPLLEKYMLEVSEMFNEGFVKSMFGRFRSLSNDSPDGCELILNNADRGGFLILRLLFMDKSSYKAIFQYEENDNLIQINYYSKERKYTIKLICNSYDFSQFVGEGEIINEINWFFTLNEMDNFEFKLSAIPFNGISNTNKPETSKNYIIIKCRDDANPKFNRLQLRTNPPTFIELHAGENILKVEDYPALKYGFSQISENDEDHRDRTMSHCPIENCQEVLSIDLSNFDGSEMTSMDEMFFSMQNLKDIYFDRLDTSNVVSMVDTFRLTGKEGKLTIDFNTAKVRDINGMLASTWYEVIELKGLNLSKVKNAEQAIDSVPLLIIDNVKLGNADIEGVFLNVPDKIIIKNCDKASISKIIEDAKACEGENVLNKIENL